MFGFLRPKRVDDVFLIQVKAEDSQDVPKNVTRQHPRGVGRVWRDEKTESHRLLVEGCFDSPVVLESYIHVQEGGRQLPLGEFPLEAVIVVGVCFQVLPACVVAFQGEVSRGHPDAIDIVYEPNVE